jgi:hypothetical protein
VVNRVNNATLSIVAGPVVATAETLARIRRRLGVR